MAKFIGLLLLCLCSGICFANNTKNILVTGYWPPTNEMLIPFSSNPQLNPNGWIGANWEGRGYDVYAFFPTFPGGTGSNAKGEGDFEVDYQDTADDFWRITSELRPVAILSFGQGMGPWEIEYNARNLPAMSWGGDYLAPYKPSTRPDDTTPASFTRHSTLPAEEIAGAVNLAKLGVKAWVDHDGNPGAFLCEYMAYHGMWYQNIHNDKTDPYRCVAAGFIHVGDVPTEKAALAFAITLRKTIERIDEVLSENE